MLKGIRHNGVTVSVQLQRKVNWAWKDAKTLAVMLRTENEETPEEFRNVFH